MSDSAVSQATGDGTERQTCGSCGSPIDGTPLFIHLEWPPDEPADPGSLEYYQCDDCADAIALTVLVARADDLDLEHMYEGLWPDGVEQPPLLSESR